MQSFCASRRQLGRELSHSMRKTTTPETQALESERSELLQRIADWLEAPMLVLALAWLALLIWELTWGLSPLLETAGIVIWIIFILNFAIEFSLAPRKLNYLKSNWLTAVSLIVPALRALRIVRMVRVLSATRGLRLIKVIGSLNRGMRALGKSFGRRGFGYVVALTAVVTLLGAAGMYAFENQAEGGLESYGEALWWTAMVMTTMGSQYWPESAEGRVLCLVLALYAFAVFGYVTATIATFFVERDAESDESEVASAASIAQLKTEISALRSEIAALSRQKDH
jgi:voltage-gated potassium channel